MMVVGGWICYGSCGGGWICHGLCGGDEEGLLPVTGHCLVASVATVLTCIAHASIATRHLTVVGATSRSGCLSLPSLTKEKWTLCASPAGALPPLSIEIEGDDVVRRCVTAVRRYVAAIRY
ncbi:hypothetical protein ACLOJK_036491 [Asimina triloba]